MLFQTRAPGLPFCLEINSVQDYLSSPGFIAGVKLRRNPEVSVGARKLVPLISSFVESHTTETCSQGAMGRALGMVGWLELAMRPECGTRLREEDRL